LDTQTEQSDELIAEPDSEDVILSESQQGATINLKKMSKKTITIAAVAAVAVIAIVIIIFQLMQKGRAAEMRQEYIDNLTNARYTMLMGAADAENLCNLTKTVWYNTIHKELDADTNKYTVNGYVEGITKYSKDEINDDFNTSLATLYSDASTISAVNGIKENREEVAALMKLLQNPTDEFVSAYNTLDTMYSYYYNLTGLAISPSGSLTTYSSNFSEYDSGCMEYYNKLDLQIPEK